MADQRQYGLVATSERTKAVHLQSIQVNVTICNTIASVTSDLVYENTADHALDTDFVFPMDDDSAVYQFEVDIDGRHIVGECQEKEQAESTFKAAKHMGYSSFLVGEADHVGDTFCMNVGNLPNGKTATIKLSYVLALKVDTQGAVDFVLPTVLNPRYTPANASAGEVASSSKMAASNVTSKPCTMKFAATIIGQLNVVEVTSQFVGITWEKKEDGHVHVSLAKEFTFASDLNLHVLYGVSKQTNIIAMGDPKKDGLLQKNILMINFFPTIDAKLPGQNNTEFIFIIDRSGSMRGENITQAKETLGLFLKSLPVGCYFNIISFGSNYEVLFSSSMKYDSDSLRQATELVQNMKANMGGTELMGPLNYMYKQMTPKKGYLREVFLLTDGDVTNKRAVTDIVKKHSDQTRVFAFGIGHGLSTSLVRGVARAGNGKAEFVRGTERLHGKVISCLESAMQRSVTNIKVEWKTKGTSKITTIPNPLPATFSGEYLVIYGISEGSTHDTSSVSAELSGKVSGVRFQETLQCSENPCDTSDLLVHRLAAKAQIKVLETLGDEQPPSDVKTKIIILSLASNVVSRHTSFVGVDSETKEQVLQMKERNDELLIEEDFYLCKGKFSDEELYEAPHDAVIDDCYEDSYDYVKEKQMSRRPPGTVNKSATIISLQTFNGSWPLDVNLADCLSSNLLDLKSRCPVKDSTVWATVLALAWLQKECASLEQEWRLIFQKAMTWLKTQNIESPHTVQSLLELAIELLHTQ